MRLGAAEGDEPQGPELSEDVREAGDPGLVGFEGAGGGQAELVVGTVCGGERGRRFGKCESGGSEIVRQKLDFG